MKKTNLKKKIIAGTLLLSVIGGSAVSSFSNVLNTPIVANAAIGTNIGGNAEGVDWGGEFFSWKLTVDGKPAFCINLGLPPTNGENMSQKIDAVTEHSEFKRLVYAGLGMDRLGLIAKYGLDEHNAYKGTIPLYHVIEGRLGYGPKKEILTEEKYRQLAEVEKQKGNTAVANYSLELLDYVLNGKLPETSVKITSPSSIVAVYNEKTNRLETAEYIVNNVQSDNITLSGLPVEVYVIDSVTGKKIDKLVKNQKFKLVTDDLTYTNKLDKLSVTSNVEEFTPIIWAFEGVQDVMQGKILSPSTFTDIQSEFKTVLGRIEFQKVNSTKNKPLINIPFELIDEDGKIVQTVKSSEGGKVIFDKVLEGKYTVKEVPVVGDGLVDEVVTVEATVVAGKTTTLKTINNKENEVSLSKLDNENNKPVEGAKVELIDNDGKVVWIGDGNSNLTGIPAGEYTLKEKIAPIRYLLNPETTKVTITEDGKLSVGIIYDETRDIEVIKKDGITGKPLKGAKFKLVRLDGSEVEMLDKDNKLILATAVSDENGVVRFRGIPIGDYKVVELEAPEGYTTNSDLIVKAEEKNDTKYDFIDYSIPEEPKTPVIQKVSELLPKTGNERIDFLLLLSFLTFSSVIMSYLGHTLFVREKKKNKTKKIRGDKHV